MRDSAPTKSLSVLIFLISVFVCAQTFAQDFPSGPPPEGRSGRGGFPGGEPPAGAREIMTLMRDHPELQPQIKKIIDDAGGPQKAFSNPDVVSKIKALASSPAKTESQASEPLVKANQTNAATNATSAEPPKPVAMNRARLDKLISGFEVSHEGTFSRSLQLQGRIPKECLPKISITASCEQNSNSIGFLLTEKVADGISCLEKNIQKCANKNSRDCVTLQQSRKENKSEFMTSINSKDEPKSCNHVNVDKVTEVKFSEKAFVVKKADSSTEGTAGCDCVTTDEFSKLKTQVSQMEEILKKAPGGNGRGIPDMANGERRGRRGPPPGDFDDEDGPPSRMGGRGGRSGPGGGFSPGGQSGGMSAMGSIGMMLGGYGGMMGSSGYGMGGYGGSNMMGGYGMMGSYGGYGTGNYGMMSGYGGMMGYGMSGMSGYGMGGYGSYMPYYSSMSYGMPSYGGYGTMGYGGYGMYGYNMMGGYGGYGMGNYLGGYSYLPGSPFNTTSSAYGGTTR